VEFPRTCPADLQVVAKAYLMHRLPEDQVEAFEEHYFGCAECATILQKAAACIDAMRGAAGKLRSDASSLPPLSRGWTAERERKNGLRGTK
jgi:hypothetical protein